MSREAGESFVILFRARLNGAILIEHAALGRGCSEGAESISFCILMPSSTNSSTASNYQGRDFAGVELFLQCYGGLVFLYLERFLEL